MTDTTHHPAPGAGLDGPGGAGEGQASLAPEGRGGARVLVCGGRDYADRQRLHDMLTTVRAEYGIACVIEGGAYGADRLAREWALENGIPVETFPADWRKLGTAAGPLRNSRMLVEGRPDIVVAFPGGRGTADMTAKALRVGIPVRLALVPTPTARGPHA